MKSICSVKIKSLPFLVLFALCTWFSVLHSYSQTSTSSPYSRYGIGDVAGRGFAQSFAMGGSSIGMQNDSTPMFFINNGNPASFPYLRLVTAELGMSYNRVILQNATQKKTVHSAALSYLSFSFPIKRWWGMSLGLAPYSSVGYNVSDQQEIANIGGVNFLYEGSGGVDQLYFGNGFRPFYGLPKMFVNSKKYNKLKLEKNNAEIYRILKRRRALQGFSFGVNGSYLFGRLDHTRRSIFDAAGNFFNTRTSATTRFNDVYFDYGAQYSFIIDSMKGRDLKQNVKITLGATFAPMTPIDARIDTLSVNYFYSSIGTEIVKDTIALSENTRGTIDLPMSLGFGLSFKKGDRWLLATDYAMQNWGDFKMFDKAAGLKNSMRISVGAQYVPNSRAVGTGNYLKRINYRLGGRYSQTALELHNTRLVEYGVTFGFGLPVGRNFMLQNFSMVNIGAELGTRGTIDSGLIKENYLKVNLGFTINDRWFVKPKFD